MAQHREIVYSSSPISSDVSSPASTFRRLLLEKEERIMQLMKQIESLKTSNSALNTLLAEQDHELEIKEKKAYELDERNKEVHSKQSIIQALEGEITFLKEALEEKSSNVANADERTKEDILNLRKENKFLQKEKNDLSDQIETLQIANNDLQKRHRSRGDAHRSLREVSEKLVESELECTMAKEKLHVLTNLLEQAEADIQRLTADKALQLESLRSRLDSSQDSFQHGEALSCVVELQLGEANDKIAQLSENIELLTQDNCYVNEECQRLKEKVTQLETVEGDLATWKSRYQTAESRFQEQANIVHQLSHQYEEKMSVISDLEQQLRDRSEQSEKISEQFSKFTIVEQKLNEYEEKLKESLSISEKLNTELDNSQKHCAHLETELYKATEILRHKEVIIIESHKNLLLSRESVNNLEQEIKTKDANFAIYVKNSTESERKHNRLNADMKEMALRLEMVSAELETVRSKAKCLLTDKEKLLNALQEKEDAFNNQVEKIEFFEEETVKMVHQVEELKAQEVILNTQIRKLKVEYSDLQETCNVMKGKADNVDSTIEQLQQQLQASIEEVKNVQRECERKISLMDDEIEAANKKNQSIVDRKMVEIKESKLQSQQLSTKLQDAKADLRSKTTELNDCILKCIELENRLDEVESSNMAQLRSLSSKLDEKQMEIEGMKAQMLILQDKNGRLRKVEKKLETERDNSSQALKQVHLLASQNENLSKNLDVAERELDKLTMKLNNIQESQETEIIGQLDAIAAMEEQLEQQQKAAEQSAQELAQMTERNNGNAQTVEKLAAQLSEAQESLMLQMQMVETLEKQLHTATEENGNISAQVAEQELQLKRQQDSFTLELAEVKERVAELERQRKIDKEILENRHYEEECECLKVLLNEKNELIEEKCSQLSRLAAEADCRELQFDDLEVSLKKSKDNVSDLSKELDQSAQQLAEVEEKNKLLVADHSTALAKAEEESELKTQKALEKTDRELLNSMAECSQLREQLNRLQMEKEVETDHLSSQIMNLECEINRIQSAKLDTDAQSSVGLPSPTGRLFFADENCSGGVCLSPCHRASSDLTLNFSKTIPTPALFKSPSLNTLVKRRGATRRQQISRMSINTNAHNSCTKVSSKWMESDEEHMDVHFEFGRLSELQKRNSRVPSHLKSSYPVETQSRQLDECTDGALKEKDAILHERPMEVESHCPHPGPKVAAEQCAPTASKLSHQASESWVIPISETSKRRAKGADSSSKLRRLADVGLSKTSSLIMSQQSSVIDSPSGNLRSSMKVSSLNGVSQMPSDSSVSTPISMASSKKKRGILAFSIGITPNRLLRSGFRKKYSIRKNGKPSSDLSVGTYTPKKK